MSTTQIQLSRLIVSPENALSDFSLIHRSWRDSPVNCAASCFQMP
jgi:hypothetical protein